MPKSPSKQTPQKRIPPLSDDRQANELAPKPEKTFRNATHRIFAFGALLNCVIVLFFAITGLTLNHVEWFSSLEKTTHHKGTMPSIWTSSPDTSKIAKLEVVEFLRNTYGVNGRISDFAIGDSECSVIFNGPGYTSDAFIIRETGEYEFSETRMGIIAFLNDLHKGQNTSSTWSFGIDTAAILMACTSVFGLVLIAKR